MRHPFDFIPPGRWSRFFWALLALTLVLMLAFQSTGAALTTPAAPYGVVSFELAGSEEQMQAILNSWSPETRQRAAFGLGLDFLFMPVYASLLAFGCGMAARALRRQDWPLANLGVLLAWLIFVAAVLDVFENVSLLQVLWSGQLAPWTQLASGFAWPKFILIFGAIVYGLYGAAVSLVGRLTKAPSA